MLCEKDAQLVFGMCTVETQRDSWTVLGVDG